MSKPLKTFIIYARTDEAYKAQLVRHLRPLRTISVWHDGDILPGEEWNAAIKRELSSSELVLFLVSADSLFSDYIQNEELQTALQLLNQGQARIIPIVISPCGWKHDPIIKELQALPLYKSEGVKPVRSWSDQDEAWASVVDHIGDMLEKHYKPPVQRQPEPVVVSPANEPEKHPDPFTSEAGLRGTNLRIKLRLTLEEMSTGISKKIKVKKLVRCTTCSGYGLRHGARCSTCSGNGIVPGEEIIDFDVPPGTTDEIQLSMAGRGNAGSNGGPNGDLIISIEEIPHETLSRDGRNVVYELYLSIADAALGATVECPTIDGRARIKVPPGTQPGKIFRLKDKGLPAIQGDEKGDQLIYVHVWIPKKVTDEERRLLDKLATMPNFKPSPTEEESKGFFSKISEMFGY